MCCRILLLYENYYLYAMMELMYCGLCLVILSNYQCQTQLIYRDLECKTEDDYTDIMNILQTLAKKVQDMENKIISGEKEQLDKIKASMQLNGLLEQKIDNMVALIKSGFFQINRSNMQNLALNKTATQSSEYSDMYPAANAVNNRSQDFTHTKETINPWLRIDLGQRYRIYQIDIINRNTDCCAGRLHDLNVKVGLSLNNMTSCGYYKGPARKAETIQIACPMFPSPLAQFVELQIVSSRKSILHVSEVRVWGLHL